MLRGREVVLVKFNPLITKQYRVYALDLRRVIKASLVVFNENILGGEIDLNLKTITSNVLLTRKPVGWPKLDIDSVSVTKHQGKSIFITESRPQGESIPAIESITLTKYQGESIPITKSRPQGESIPAIESKIITIKILFKPQPLDVKEVEQDEK